MWTSRRCISIGVLPLILATVPWGVSASSAEPLFTGDDVLHLTIHGPLTRLARRTPGSTDVRGSLEMADGRMIPMTFSRYGLSRLRECGLPCYKITIEEDDARGTVFEGQPTLRLVTPCQYGNSYDRYILLEYLVYESFAVITEPALRTRLVSCRFRDSEKPAFKETSLAFFVEDIGLAADRHDKTWLDIRSQRIADLDPAQLALLALFQFMVGNTDWSALSSAAGQPCCHNVAALGAEGDKHGGTPRFAVRSRHPVRYAGLGVRQGIDATSGAEPRDLTSSASNRSKRQNPDLDQGTTLHPEDRCAGTLRMPRSAGASHQP